MAVILTQGRPAVTADGLAAAVGLMGPAWEDAAAFLAAITGITSAVGRVEFADPSPIPYLGTTFLVGPRLALTILHSHTVGLGDQRVGVRDDKKLAIRFGPADAEPIAVAKVRFVHPGTQIVGLELETEPDAEPLRLESREPMDLKDRAVAVVAYNARDPRGNEEATARIFNGLVQRQAVSPGTLTGRAGFSLAGRQVDTVTHDCSTTGGASGAPIVDARTGRVLGVHFAGHAKRANYAIPSWDLARDPRLHRHGVGFSLPVSPWEPLWAEHDAGGALAAQPPAPPPTDAPPEHATRLDHDAYVFLHHGKEVGRAKRYAAPEEGLARLVSENWSRADLEGLIKYKVPAPQLVHELPAGTVPDFEHAAAAVDKLVARGLIEPFIDALLSDRPQLVFMLSDIRTRWL